MAIGSYTAVMAIGSVVLKVMRLVHGVSMPCDRIRSDVSSAALPSATLVSMASAAPSMFQDTRIGYSTESVTSTVLLTRISGDFMADSNAQPRATHSSMFIVEPR